MSFSPAKWLGSKAMWKVPLVEAVAVANAAKLAKAEEPVIFPQETVIGSMAYYITHAAGKHFQPMNANFGLLPELPRTDQIKLRYETLANRALTALADTSF